MKKKKRQPKTPEYCPVCNEDVPPNAKSCPNCGACHKSGWKEEFDEYSDSDDEEVDWDVVDLPDEVLDEDELRAKHSRQAKRAIPSKWRLVALILVVMWLMWFAWFNGWFRLW